nr:late embryogenesis abundant protein LEA34 [Pinus tabuliformis]
MADDQRVYPAAASSDGNASVAAREKAPRSYIVQLPKEQVYRTAAPPQHRYAPSPPPRRRRNPCCCCLAWIFCPLILLIVLIAIAAGVFYIVFRPQIPKYSLNGISVQRFNISQDLRLSSDLIVTVRAQNPNKKIGIFYDDGNRLAVLYSGRVISSGVIPAFYQAPRKTTLVRIKMTASRVPFSAALKSALDTDQTKGSVPLYVEMDEPVRLKFGSLKTPKVTIQLRCKLTVNQLTAKRKVRIQEQSCSIRIKL